MDLLAALEERGTLDRVSSIDLSAGTEILLRYDGRFDVKLPISGDFTSQAAGTGGGGGRSGRAMRPGQWT